MTPRFSQVYPYPSSSSAQVAGNHYTSWSAANWFLGYALIGVAVVLAAIAVVLWIAGKSNDDDLGVLGTAALLGVISAIIGAIAFWQVARHIEQIEWVSLLGLAMIGSVTLACYRAARSDLADAFEPSYYVRRSALTYAIPFGVSGVIVLGVCIGDGANRLAASVPMAVGTFVGLVAAGALGLVAYAASSSNARR